MDVARSRAEALELDRADPLAPLRGRFEIPDGVVYLDGNSLGPPPRDVSNRLEDLVRRQWGTDLISSWNVHDWIGLAQKIGAAIAPLIGAEAGEVMVADSTSVNLFKLLGAARRLRPDRPVILTEAQNFPTDVYIARAAASWLHPPAEVKVVDRDTLVANLDERVAVMILTHVDFRSGERHDLAGLTAAAHEVGALALWDLAHSAGAVPVELDSCEVDLAVGCGYKYLNGGPGAPAFAFVATRHHANLETPLPGWMGHAAPFAMDLDYRPAPGIGQLACGTPPILALAALECGVSTLADVGIARLRHKSLGLTETFIAAVERSGVELELASPRDPEWRGSQVSWRHPRGYPVVQALIAEGVVGDFRAPDLVRFGFAPAYVRYVDAWDAATRLVEITRTGSWDRPEFHRRATVT